MISDLYGQDPGLITERSGALFEQCMHTASAYIFCIKEKVEKYHCFLVLTRYNHGITKGEIVLLNNVKHTLLKTIFYTDGFYAGISPVRGMGRN